MILFLVQTLGKKHTHTVSLSKKPFFMDSRLGRKQEITDSLGRSQIRQSLAESENWWTSLHLVLI